MKVLDVNDQNPKFEFSLYTKTIPEGTAAIGTLTATVSASDADIGVNKEVRQALTVVGSLSLLQLVVGR